MNPELEATLKRAMYAIEANEADTISHIMRTQLWPHARKAAELVSKPAVDGEYPFCKNLNLITNIGFEHLRKIFTLINHKCNVTNTQDVIEFILGPDRAAEHLLQDDTVYEFEAIVSQSSRNWVRIEVQASTTEWQIRAMVANDFLGLLPYKSTFIEHITPEDLRGICEHEATYEYFGGYTHITFDTGPVKIKMPLKGTPAHAIEKNHSITITPSN